MCTKFWSDGDVHKYFSSFDRPEDAFANFMNILADFKTKIFAEFLKGREL
jgi:alpha-amylase